MKKFLHALFFLLLAAYNAPSNAQYLPFPVINTTAAVADCSVSGVGNNISHPGGVARYQYIITGTINCPTSRLMSYEMVAGGSSGGGQEAIKGGGGGAAGQYKSGTVTVPSGISTITVGTGGVVAALCVGNDGTDSSIGALVTATHGAGPACPVNGGNAGGTSGSGNAGGTPNNAGQQTTGGGGGDVAVGGNASTTQGGVGGNGRVPTLIPLSFVADGGSGASNNGTTKAAGGLGSGGQGGASTSGACLPTAPTANSGSGGAPPCRNGGVANSTAGADGQIVLSQ